MPGIFYGTLNFFGMVSKSLHWISSALFNVREWFGELFGFKVAKFIAQVKHYSTVYNQLVPSHDLDAAVGSVAALPEHHTSLEPLIGLAPEDDEFATLAIASATIRRVVTAPGDCGFDVDWYQRLGDAMETASVVTVPDIIGFFRAYVVSTLRSLLKSFRRRVWMTKAMKRIKNKHTQANAQERHGWLLMSDQCDWYQKHDLYIVDIAAALLQREDGACGASIFRLWASIDFVLSFIPKLLFSPLWDPSPRKRAADLTNRLRLIEHLGEVR